MRFMRFAAVLVAALLFFAATAFAAPPADDTQQRAARSFVEGQRAFEAGDYRRAATSFEAAYAAKPHHSALWNAARSWQRAGEDLLAANLLERYLRDAPKDAQDRDEATSALNALNKKLGRVQIQVVNATAMKLDGNTPSQNQSTFYVAPGDHVVSGIDAGDKPIKKMFSVKAGELLSVTLNGEQAAEKPVPPPVVVTTPPPPSESQPLPPWVVYAGGGLTVVGGVLTVLSGVDTIDKRDAFLDDQTQSRLDDGYSAQARTNVALGITAGVAVLTAVAAVFFVDWKGPAKNVGVLRW